MTITAYSGYGTLIKRGDGGSSAATKASRTIGSSNQQLKILAAVAGAAGNSKTCSILVSGNNTAFSFTVSSSNLVITSATDGSGVATTTVLQAIAALYADATFRASWDATIGTGNGSGVLVAGSSAALTGGADSTEVFTTIDGARSISGPQFSLETFDVTHHTSNSSYRQIKPSFKSAGEVSFELIYDPADAEHEGLLTDFENRTLRNFRMILPDLGGMQYDFSAYVSGAEVGAPIDNALTLSVRLGIDGAVTRTA
jgi:hypothetical protein